jgi:hypothetical protein
MDKQWVDIVDLLMHETAPGLEFGNKVYRVRFDENYSDKVLNYETFLLSTFGTRIL